MADTHCPEHSGIAAKLDSIDVNVRGLREDIIALRENHLHGVYERLTKVEQSCAAGAEREKAIKETLERIEAQMLEFAKRKEEEPPAVTGQDGLTRKEFLTYLGVAAAVVMGIINMIVGHISGRGK